MWCRWLWIVEGAQPSSRADLLGGRIRRRSAAAPGPRGRSAPAGARGASVSGDEISSASSASDARPHASAPSRSALDRGRVAVGRVGGDVGEPHRLGDRARRAGGRRGGARGARQRSSGSAPAARDPGADAGVVRAEQCALVVDAGDGARRHVEPALVGDGRQDRLAQVVEQPGQVGLRGAGGRAASARSAGPSRPPRPSGAAGTPAAGRRRARGRRAGGRCWRPAAAPRSVLLADAHHGALERVDRLGEQGRVAQPQHLGRELGALGDPRRDQAGGRAAVVEHPQHAGDHRRGRRQPVGRVGHRARADAGRPGGRERRARRRGTWASAPYVAVAGPSRWRRGPPGRAGRRRRPGRTRCPRAAPGRAWRRPRSSAGAPGRRRSGGRRRRPPRAPGSPPGSPRRSGRTGSPRRRSARGGAAPTGRRAPGGCPRASARRSRDGGAAPPPGPRSARRRRR